MATFRITPETADRTMRLIAHHANDLAAARHDIRIGLDSLGGYYTDRKSEAVLSLLDWLIAHDAKFPDTIAKRREQLADIAAKHRAVS